MNEDLAARYLDGDTLSADDLAELGPDDLAELEDFQRLLGDPLLWDEPAPELEDRIVEAIAAEANPVSELPSNVIPIDRARRRTVRTALLSAAAAALIAAGVTKGLTGGGGGQVDTGVQLALPDNRVGALQIKDTQSGLRIHLNVPDLERLPVGEFYQGWLRSNDGKRLVAIGTFHTGVDVTLWAGVQLEEFSTLTVTREPDDGDPKSSGNRVLVVDLTPIIGKS